MEVDDPAWIRLWVIGKESSVGIDVIWVVAMHASNWLGTHVAWNQQHARIGQEDIVAEARIGKVAAQAS